MKEISRYPIDPSKSIFDYDEHPKHPENKFNYVIDENGIVIKGIMYEAKQEKIKKEIDGFIWTREETVVYEFNLDKDYKNNKLDNFHKLEIKEFMFITGKTYNILYPRYFYEFKSWRDIFPELFKNELKKTTYYRESFLPQFLIWSNIISKDVFFDLWEDSFCRDRSEDEEKIPKIVNNNLIGPIDFIRNGNNSKRWYLYINIHLKELKHLDKLKESLYYDGGNKDDNYNNYVYYDLEKILFKNKESNDTESVQKTYLMKDKNTGYYKIGKSYNPKHRERTLQSEKPTISMVWSVDKDIESQLHNKYESQRVRGEWFELNKTQVKYICTHH